MKKIIVIGCPGSGKSTFSLALGEKTSIPVYHLDMMFWNEDGTTVDKETFLHRLRIVIREECFIIDGNYSSTMDERISAADSVFFLDYPVDICLSGVRERIGKPRKDMPWTEREEDGEFIEYIKNFERDQRPKILELLRKYSDKSITVFKSRSDADKYLNGE